MKWIRFYWGDVEDIFAFSDKKMFIVDCSNVDHSATDPLHESIRLVHEIASQYPPPYYLLVSGGIDSQAMLWAWLKSGVPFQAVNFTYNNDYNIRDTIPIQIFCEKNGIPLESIDIDYFHFLEHELLEQCKKYYCNSPQITLHIKFSEILKGGTTLYSGSPTSSAGTYTNYTQLGTYRYKLLTGRSCVPFFFTETPRIAGAFVNQYKKIVSDPFMQLMSDVPHHGMHYSKKAYLYLYSGFEVIPTLKLTGFEIYKKYYDKFDHLVSTKQRLKYANKPSKRVFDLLFRYPLFEINKYNEKTHYLL